MPNKMQMYLQKKQNSISPQPFLHNMHANKPIMNVIAPVSVKKLSSASLSKMPMVERVSGVKPGCGSCGKRS